jgi:hypothetical protein
MSRLTFKPITALLLVGVVACIVIAVIYLTHTAMHLPSFMPGHNAKSKVTHVKRGIAFIGLGVVLLIGAWFVSAPKKVSTSE